MADRTEGKPPLIEGSAFEGMFQRALKPAGRFAEELAQAGYDLRMPLPRYPTPVWNACIEVARRHEYPDLPPHKGLHSLGRRLGAGFLNTIIGKVIGAGLTLVGTEGTVRRVPRYLMSVTPGVTVTIEREGDTRWRLRSQDAYALPDITAGLLEEGLSRTGRRVTVEVAARRSDGYELLIHW